MKNTTRKVCLKLVTFFVLAATGSSYSMDKQTPDTAKKDVQQVETKTKKEQSVTTETSELKKKSETTGLQDPTTLLSQYCQSSKVSLQTQQNIKSVETKEAFETFVAWNKACKTTEKTKIADNKTPLTAQEFKRVLEKFLSVMANDSDFSNKESWVENTTETTTKLSSLTKAQKPNALPFAQKITVSEDTQCVFQSDLHGDMKALRLYLKKLKKNGDLDKKFKITNKKLQLIFLGDYVDHKDYGVEVLYTLMRLKIANPNQVHLLRGNHEDIVYNNEYSFADEFSAKFENQKELYELTCHLYDFLPVALYVGTGSDYVLCCHGAIELGFNPKPLLQKKNSSAFDWLEPLDSLFKNAETLRLTLFAEQEKPYVYSRKNYLEQNALQAFYGKEWIKGKDDNRQVNGFILNHFHHKGNQWKISDADDNSLSYNGRNGTLSLSKNVTKKILNHFSTDSAIIHGVFCSQESDMIMCNSKKNIMKLYAPENNTETALWDGVVCGFSAKHALATLTLGKTFKDWKTNF